MSLKEIWFVCPTCARPIRCEAKLFGTVFEHPACGATLRAPEPKKGEEDPVLIAGPNQELPEGASHAQIEDVEGEGLFVPRRLREAEAEDDNADAAGAEEVKILAEEIAKVLLDKKIDGTADLAAGLAGAMLAKDGGSDAAEEEPEEKKSRMGFGKAPVDPGELKESFVKSTEEYEADGEGVNEDALASHTLTQAHEERIMKEVTPWEKEGSSEQRQQAAAGPPPAKVGIMKTALWILIMVALIGGVILLSSKRESRGKDKEPEKVFRPKG